MATRPKPAATPAPSRDAGPASTRTPPVPGTGVTASGVTTLPGLKIAAAAQGLEAVVLLVAAVFAAVATARGQSYERGSGIALTLIAVGTAAGLASFAAGLLRARPWTRTPVVMTQLFVGGAGIYLIIGHRWVWGIPALALAALCLVGVFLPASLRALNRPPMDGPREAPAPAPQASSKAQAGSKTQQKTPAQASTRSGHNTKRPPANRKRKHKPRR